MESTEFFSTAAQVIPILLIILVFEFRIFGGEGQGGWWASSRQPGPGERVRTPNALFGALFLILLFAAEVLALEAVRTGGGSPTAEAIVSAAILLSLLVILLVPAGPLLLILLDRTPAYRARVWALRRGGRLAPSDPDPPRSGEGPPPPEEPPSMHGEPTTRE